MRAIILIISLFIFSSCTNTTEPTSNTSINSSTSLSSDHSVSEKGVMHKSGLNNASTNCVLCHGSDLKGGSVNVSCYNCHSKLWS